MLQHMRCWFARPAVRFGGCAPTPPQCMRFSPEHNALVVSMGSGSSCGAEWTSTRAALVSRDHAARNATRAARGPTAAEAAAQEARWRAEVEDVRPYFAADPELWRRLPAEHRQTYATHLARFGLPPLDGGS